MEARFGAQAAQGGGLQGPEAEALVEKVRALETRQSKVTAHIVDLSKKLAASATDARTHEDALRKHITDTVSTCWGLSRA